MSAPRKPVVSLRHLRAHAERSLLKTPRKFGKVPVADEQKLMHELQVHQVELEMQNEQLRQTELELERALERYADLYNFAPTAYLTLNADAEILEANLAAAKLLGLERGRLIRKKFTRFLPMEAQDTFYLFRRQVFGKDTPQRVELNLVDANSKRIAVQMDAVRDGSCGRKQFRVGLTDITASRLAAEQLRQSEERLQAITDNTPAQIFLKDLQGRYLHFNRRVAEVMHLSFEQSAGLTDADLLAPEQAKAFRASDQKTLTAGVPMDFEEVIPLDDGPHMFLVTKFPLRDAKGKIYAIGGIATDITERKRMEESLRRSEYSLASFFNQAPIGLEWLSASGTILRANKAQLDLLGYSTEEYLGRLFSDFCADPGDARSLLEQLAANETVHNLRIPRRCKDGTLRLVLVDAQPTCHEGQFLYSSVFSRDITDRFELERELLEISEREQRRIAQDLHDGLGQVLVATRFLGGNLRQKLAARHVPEVRQFDRLLRVLDDAVKQTRSLSRGLHPVKPEPNGLMVALKDLASQTTTWFQVPCHFTCRRNVLIEDNIAATHLYRIAQEAVTNAIKHGKPGRIQICLTRTPDRVNLMVKDNGAGLSAGPRTKRGMGLRIMRYRAGVIGGSLAIQKETGGGTAVICSVHESARILTDRPDRLTATTP